TENVRVHEPWSALAASVKSINDPQATPVPTVKAYDGAVLDTAPCVGRSGNAAAARVTVTPGVLVERIADTFVRFTMPLFLRDTVSATSSPGSTAPFVPPGPPTEHAAAGVLDAYISDGPQTRSGWHSSGM